MGWIDDLEAGNVVEFRPHPLRTWRRRRPKWSHPCPVCNRRGFVAPHAGQHVVKQGV